MSAAASAMALAREHGVSISLDGSDLILESRGSIAPEVRAVIRQAKADLITLLARRDTDPTGALAGDDLLDALRRKGFVISYDGSVPLPEVVEKHHVFFLRLQAWSSPAAR
jgi:hypothetical protein